MASELTPEQALALHLMRQAGLGLIAGGAEKSWARDRAYTIDNRVWPTQDLRKAFLAGNRQTKGGAH